jgi:hypothetical protein
MVALCIAVGALILAVIGCAVLDPRPLWASRDADGEKYRPITDEMALSAF